MATKVELAWMDKMVVPAQTTARLWRVPASITLAQCSIESAWGTSQLSRQANNYFGIKAVQGEDYMEFSTKEVIEGKAVSEMAKFARYGSPVDSFAAHAHLLATLSRYKPCMAAGLDIPEFASQLQLCGYSTSPTYAANLLAQIRCYKLQQYDVPPPAQPAVAMEPR